MSTRDYFYSISSIDPIRDAVACGDDALVEAVVSLRTRARIKEFGEESHEDAAVFRYYVESMLKCDPSPAVEPGCWTYVVEYLAKLFTVEPDYNLPFNEGWKHYHTWNPYRMLVTKHVSSQVLTSLEHLENGRPFRGKKVDHDGCVFAWLSPAEVKELHESLSRMHESAIAESDLLDFHGTLVESLRLVASDLKSLYMSAY